MTDFDNTNRGALFRNTEKGGEGTDKWPDYQGSINVGGREFWLSAWINTSKKGTKFMSLAVKPKDADNAKSKASVAEDLSDSMPF